MGKITNDRIELTITVNGSAKQGGGFFGKMAQSFTDYQALAMGIMATVVGAGLIYKEYIAFSIHDFS